MTSKAHIGKQAARLAAMPYFPSDERREPFLRETIAVLGRWCFTDAHVTAVVDDILGECRERCPSPAQIRDIAYRMRPPRGEGKCRACDGTGYVCFDDEEGRGFARRCAVCRPAEGAAAL